MIDPADKQTAELPLEQPKRGRGRPSTGQAMTPAEKQRAYRQRLADQQKSQVPAVQLEKVRSTAAEYLEKLGQQLADAKAEAATAIIRAEKAEAELAKAQKGNVTKIKKHRDDTPLKTIKAAHRQMEERRKSGELNELDALWRFVGATLQTLEQHDIKEAE